MRPPDKRKPGRGGPSFQRNSKAQQLSNLKDKPQSTKIQVDPLTWFAAAFFRHGRHRMRAFI